VRNNLSVSSTGWITLLLTLPITHPSGVATSYSGDFDNLGDLGTNKHSDNEAGGELCNCFMFVSMATGPPFGGWLPYGKNGEDGEN